MQINGRDIDFVRDNLSNATAYYSNGNDLKITIPKDRLVDEINNVFVYRLVAFTKKYATFLEEENESIIQKAADFIKKFKKPRHS